MFACIFDVKKAEFLESKNPLSEAIKETARLCGTSSKSVRKIIKEKSLFGDFIGPSYSKVRYSVYEKLTIIQRDAIRSKVHEEMQRCTNKEEGAKYPTTKSLHEAIMSIDGMPKWSKITTYHCLRNMGFTWLQNHQERRPFKQ